VRGRGRLHARVLRGQACDSKEGEWWCFESDKVARGALDNCFRRLEESFGRVRGSWFVVRGSCFTSEAESVVAGIRLGAEVSTERWGGLLACGTRGLFEPRVLP